VGKSEPTYNASSYEILDVLGRDEGKGLNLNPFGEIIHFDQEEFCLPFS